MGVQVQFTNQSTTQPTNQPTKKSTVAMKYDALPATKTPQYLDRAKTREKLMPHGGIIHA